MGGDGGTRQHGSPSEFLGYEGWAGTVRDEAGEMLRDWIVMLRLCSVDQSQRDYLRGRNGLKGALEFKSRCPKALVSEGLGVS